jgi:alpha-amylase
MHRKSSITVDRRELTAYRNHRLQRLTYCIRHLFGIQFFDHVFDWNLKQEISTLAAVRSRNGIHSGSKLDILAADSDLYLAKIDDKVMMKIGSRYDVGNLIPSDFRVVAHGSNYCVWEKSGVRVPAGRHR